MKNWIYILIGAIAMIVIALIVANVNMTPVVATLLYALAGALIAYVTANAVSKKMCNKKIRTIV